ncbi:S9 family peptidase [Shouchella shacheensis]|uniref:S9 family peptidase n=1 Tax=Shouchella shacheensis TaxID=1649580 RepID=UPI00073FF9EC|nr:prolyl oligopeptidase family serine peptidase [Shouchella shacheensis]
MLTFNKPDVTQFFKMFTIQTFAVSPNEDQVVFSINISGRFELWAMDSVKRFPYQLTSIGQNCNRLLYSKDGTFIIAAFDNDGDENTQAYALPREGGVLKPLLVEEGERHMLEGLAEDGERLYYATTSGNPTYLNVKRYDLKTGEEELLLEGAEGATWISEKNKEESRFIITRLFANTYTVAYVLEDGKLYSIVPDATNVHQTQGATFTSEKDVYVSTNYKADRKYLAHFDAEAKVFTKEIELEEESIERIYTTEDKKNLYLQVSAGVEDKLYRYSPERKELEEIKLPVSVIDQLSVSESGRLYILGRTATKSFNLYRQADPGWEALTDVSVPGVAEEDLSEPEVLRYPSFDGLQIEALYFKPRPEVDNGHLILWPHGGPQASERKNFSSWFQYLIYEGYHIVAPNFRGSSDYGAAFMKMVEGDWGHGPRLDNIACVEYMIDKGYADKDKVLLMGGSYGGYMALLLHGRHADYFKAVVNIFGVSNLFSFYDSVPEFWKPMMTTWLGDPVKDKARFEKDSPTTYLEGMTKPMLVIQGANDPRVVKQESDQIVESLRANGAEVEYIVFEDEGHGFSKTENKTMVCERILAFFNRVI